MSRTAPTAVPVHELLANRWSTRAFDPTHDVTDEQLAAVLEAARWSPSANNMQPWRYIVGRRGDDTFKKVFETLMGFNAAWAGNAGVLIVALAKATNAEGQPNVYAQYDTGQSVAHLTIQAEAEGLLTHQMGGFDRQAITEVFGLSEDLVPTAVIAVGALAAEHDLPEALAERESAPRERLALDDLLVGAQD